MKTLLAITALALGLVSGTADEAVCTNKRARVPT